MSMDGNGNELFVAGHSDASKFILVSMGWYDKDTPVMKEQTVPTTWGSAQIQ